MVEIEITIRLIIVLSSPALEHKESARIRPGRAADLRGVGSATGALPFLARHFPKHPRPFLA